ncbi:MAG: hypothetical protein LKCHEGNO_00965 [Burkholderiaceae bacterium]|nr:hypothetical protein [Burkholderiaceae bacterium]
MDHRLASRAQPARQPWPAFDDDEESSGLEPWALDEVDGDFATSSIHLHHDRDAALE